MIFGKTNTPAFAGDLQTFNPIFGTTNNPWDTTRTTVDRRVGPPLRSPQA